MFKLKRAINPAAAGPSRRRDRPIGMIIKRNEDELLHDSTKPERAQVMKVARAIKKKWRDAFRKFSIKSFDDPRRRTKPQTRTPFAGIEQRQIQRLISPRVVEIEMKCAVQNN